MFQVARVKGMGGSRNPGLEARVDAGNRSLHPENAFCPRGDKPFALFTGFQ
ncbi:hypothetical protein GCM10007385_05640 [Tateyamaria omphalii]|nr:hypothetical protein GCM10007385_05640 [Tateyamaria omphalii]